MRLQDVHARLAAFPKKIAEAEARTAAAKAELEKSKAAQLATVKDRKRYELDVEGWKEKVRKYKDQTSQIKTNEAYKALQHEVQMAEEQIAKAEDRLLEQMVSGEEYDRRIKVSEKALKEVEEIVRGERSKIEAEKAEDDKSLAELNIKRAAIVPRIPEKMMDHYDRIVKKTSRRGAGRSSRRKMHRLRNARAAARFPGNAASKQRGNVSLRDLHAYSLLLRAGVFGGLSFRRYAFRSHRLPFQ